MAVQAGLGNRALNFSLEFVGGSTTTFTFDKEYTAEEIEDNIIPVIRDAAYYRGSAAEGCRFNTGFIQDIRSFT